jgi:hypothetical protein
MLLFSGPSGFQGGAVSGGLLYGVNESSQEVEAFMLPGGTAQALAGGVLSQHTHAVGVDAATGQLYVASFDNVIRKLNLDGTFGDTVVSSSGSAVQDIEYFHGDFLAVGGDFPVGSLELIDGATGVRTTQLTSAQLSAAGIDFPQGVAVQTPEPSMFFVFAGLATCVAVGRIVSASRL